jgi:hypothetical protein
LENARSEKIAAFGRVGILEERLKEQTEKLQSECKRSQEIMASQRELFQENETLKSEMAKKDKDMMILKHNNTIVEKRNIDVEQRNTGINFKPFFRKFPYFSKVNVSYSTLFHSSTSSRGPDWPMSSDY